MKAFVLSIFDGEGTAILAVVLANSREEALQILGSENDAEDNGRKITVPTKGVDDEVRRDCEDAVFSDIMLKEVPVVIT